MKVDCMKHLNGNRLLSWLTTTEALLTATAYYYPAKLITHLNRNIASYYKAFYFNRSSNCFEFACALFHAVFEPFPFNTT